MRSNIYNILSSQIQKEGEISPFLFLSQESEVFHENILQSIQQLLQDYAIDSLSLFHLVDTGEKLKLEEVKNFISQGNMQSRFKFQVFFIENISRMTPQAQNACLKFFEEPGSGNIIVLTNQSESGILETILSRLQIYSFYKKSPLSINIFYETLILDYISKKNQEIITYFFSAKLEKLEYINFLKTLLSILIQQGKFLSLMDELHEDISGILKNNLQGKYIVDKYIILLKK